MKRSMMQCYVKNSPKAVERYIEAFDAVLVSSYKNEDGTYLHAELNIDGQILALSEIQDKYETGNTMQFCFHYNADESDKVRKAYQVLKEGAIINDVLGPCFYSDLMTDLVDEFGVHWCLFI